MFIAKKPRIYNEEKTVSSTNGAGKTGLSYTNTKINCKEMNNLNIRPETIKLSEEHIGCQLLDLDLGDDVLGLIPKAKKQKM